jgi:hypothetical protein
MTVSAIVGAVAGLQECSLGKSARLATLPTARAGSFTRAGARARCHTEGV